MCAKLNSISKEEKAFALNGLESSKKSSRFCKLHPMTFLVLLPTAVSSFMYISSEEDEIS